MAVDPGKSGAVAFLRSDYSEIHVFIMPITGKGKKSMVDARKVAEWIAKYQPQAAVIEKAQAMPKNGAVGMFNYGTGYGMVLGVLEGVGVAYSLVTPQAWKKDVLAGTTKDKDAAIQFVTRRFPGINLMKSDHPSCKKPHDGKADAACIAVHAVRVWGAHSSAQPQPPQSSLSKRLG
jgi:crossover junction endodeoxyribonuclease RuvC